MVIACQITILVQQKKGSNTQSSNDRKTKLISHLLKSNEKFLQLNSGGQQLVIQSLVLEKEIVQKILKHFQDK